jgi:hypothetical protein
MAVRVFRRPLPGWRTLSSGSEFRGPGGISATDLFAKVQEANRRDAEPRTPDASKLSVKKLIALLQPHMGPDELAGIKDKDELVRRVRLLQSQTTDD